MSDLTVLHPPADALTAGDMIAQAEPWFLSGWSRHISPSSLGRAAACVRSEAMPHVHDNTPAARKGTVAHKFLADCLEHGRDLALGMTESPDDIDWLSGIDVERLPAFEPSAYEPEVAIAYNPTTRTARALGKNLSRSEARALATDEELVGIIDVLGQTADDAVAHDYKTGHGFVEPAEVNWQLKTYALFAARWLGKEGATYSVIRVKDTGAVFFDTARMDELDLLAHEEALIALLAERVRVRRLTRDGRWADLPPLVEGKHCRYCPAMHVCPAKVHAIRIIGTPLEDTSLAQGPITEEQKRTAWLKLKAARRTLDRYDAILRDLARQEPIQLGDGEVLGEKLGTREGIVVDRARATLERQFGPLGAAVVGDAAETKTTLTKKALKSALKRLVLPTLPKGDQKIGQLNDSTMRLLRESGAVTVTQTRTVTEWTPKADGAPDAPEEIEAA